MDGTQQHNQSLQAHDGSDRKSRWSSFDAFEKAFIYPLVLMESGTDIEHNTHSNSGTEMSNASISSPGIGRKRAYSQSSNNSTSYTSAMSVYSRSATVDNGMLDSVSNSCSNTIDNIGSLKSSYSVGDRIIPMGGGPSAHSVSLSGRRRLLPWAKFRHQPLLQDDANDEDDVGVYDYREEEDIGRRGARDHIVLSGDDDVEAGSYLLRETKQGEELLANRPYIRLSSGLQISRPPLSSKACMEGANTNAAPISKPCLPSRSSSWDPHDSPYTLSRSSSWAHDEDRDYPDNCIDNVVSVDGGNNEECCDGTIGGDRYQQKFERISEFLQTEIERSQNSDGRPSSASERLIRKGSEGFGGVVEAGPGVVDGKPSEHVPRMNRSRGGDTSKSDAAMSVSTASSMRSNNLRVMTDEPDPLSQPLYGMEQIKHWSPMSSGGGTVQYHSIVSLCIIVVCFPHFSIEFYYFISSARSP